MRWTTRCAQLVPAAAAGKMPAHHHLWPEHAFFPRGVDFPRSVRVERPGGRRSVPVRVGVLLVLVPRSPRNGPPTPVVPGSSSGPPPPRRETNGGRWRRLLRSLLPRRGAAEGPPPCREGRKRGPSPPPGMSSGRGTRYPPKVGLSPRRTKATSSRKCHDRFPARGSPVLPPLGPCREEDAVLSRLSPGRLGRRRTSDRSHTRSFPAHPRASPRPPSPSPSPGRLVASRLRSRDARPRARFVSSPPGNRRRRRVVE